MITFADILDAKMRLGRRVVHTPLLRIPSLDPWLSCRVWLKFEGFQVMGAFKIRGALNRALSLAPDVLSRGLVCASSGNHAQGVACAASWLGVPAVVVMPENVNPVKLAGVRAFGAEVEFAGTLSSEREARAMELASEGMTNIHPYADPLVAAGQGTIGLEIIEDLPRPEAVICPIGGGGLISGVSVAVRSLSRDTWVIGAEPAGAPRYTLSREAGRPVCLEKVNTIADGTRTDRANPDNFRTIETWVNELYTVEDRWILKAMRLLLDHAKLAVEPSGALPVAAALSGAIPVEPDDDIVFVLSGGNVDPALLRQILDMPEPEMPV